MPKPAAQRLTFPELAETIDRAISSAYQAEAAQEHTKAALNMTEAVVHAIMGVEAAFTTATAAINEVLAAANAESESSKVPEPKPRKAKTAAQQPQAESEPGPEPEPPSFEDYLSRQIAEAQRDGYTIPFTPPEPEK